ncbi:hypothetical protein ABZP36_001073 [Zizania latifolia]
MAMAVFAMTAITTSTAQNSPNDFVNLHNAARAEVGVSQVSWDQTRAAYAQSYASQRARDCSTMHSNTGGRIGENLWAAWGSGSHTAADAVSSWVNEKQCMQNKPECVFHYVFLENKTNQMVMDEMLLQIGNWSRWLQDKFGMVAADSEKDDQTGDDSDDRRDAADLRSFKLLNELSDLLMLPKDMLLEKSIRKEVCPSTGLPLVTRILCNFTPDEFCPEPVPGMVLEELNAELRHLFAKCYYCSML